MFFKDNKGQLEALWCSEVIHYSYNIPFLDQVNISTSNILSVKHIENIFLTLMHMKIFLDTFSHFIRENKLDMQKILENVTIKIDLLGEKVN